MTGFYIRVTLAFNGLKQRSRNLNLKKYIINYRKSNENNFNQDLHNQLSSEQPKDYVSFEKILLSILEEHAALKKKLQRANQAAYVTKALRKAIMRRSYFEKLYFKKRTPSSFKKYKKQKTLL